MTTQNPHPAGRADDPAPADRDRADDPAPADRDRAGDPASEPAAGESDTREPVGEPIITARGVRKSFPLGRSDSIEILHGIDLDIYPGEFVAIVGASGSGKSTLLYALSGIDLPTSGTVTIAGQDLAQLSVKQLEEFRLNHIGFIFQQPQLLDGVTLRENALLPAQWHSKPHQQAAAADADRWFRQLGIDHVAHIDAAAASGGQRQRAGIIRALVNNPDVCFADEPTGALDSENAAAVLDVLTKLHQDGLTIVMVTHDAAVAARAQRIITVTDGVVPAA